MKGLKLCLIGMVAALWLLPAGPAVAEENPLDPKADYDAPVGDLPSWLHYQNPYQGEQDSLTNPHRTPDEITDWAQNILVEILSLTPENHNDKLRQHRPYFTQNGWSEYAQYMNTSGLLNLLRHQNYSLSTIIDGLPGILNRETTNTTYRWTIEVPVITSLNAQSGSPQNKPQRIVVQIVRTAADQSADENQVAIDRWSVIR